MIDQEAYNHSQKILGECTAKLYEQVGRIQSLEIATSINAIVKSLLKTQIKDLEAQVEKLQIEVTNFELQIDDLTSEEHSVAQLRQQLTHSVVDKQKAYFAIGQLQRANDNLLKNSKAFPRISYLPEGTTHVSVSQAYRGPGGAYTLTVYAFKYDTDNTLMVYRSDNENEYPQWVPADRQFKRIPELMYYAKD